MRQLQCPRCHALVAVPEGESPVCPHCGYGTPAPAKAAFGGKALVAGIVALVLVLVAVGAVLAMAGHGKSAGGTPAPTQAASGSATATGGGALPSASSSLNSTGAPAAGTTSSTGSTPSASTTSSAASGPATLALLTHSRYRDSLGYVHVVGEVKDTGGSNAGSIKVNAVFRDATGATLGNQTSGSALDILVPGGVSPFEVVRQDKDAQVADVTLTVSGLTTADPPVAAGELTTQGATTRTDGTGPRHVAGQVHNAASRTATAVDVVATFYDGDGTVVATKSTVTDPADVPAGGTGAFDFRLALDTPAYASYALAVQADALQ